MEHTVIPASDALNKTDIEGACNLLRIVLQLRYSCIRCYALIFRLEMHRYLSVVEAFVEQKTIETMSSIGPCQGLRGKLCLSLFSELSEPPSSTAYCDVSKGVTRDTVKEKYRYQESCK
ncbi:hypothetical protein V6N11_032114 [Hibiscus sabdariffa]|uniref:Uncharacterized protein n=1 Tax=Hibiscus sabdariffa TaxID=183260 RepID=A0ABR2T0E0_9ROSI